MPPLVGVAVKVTLVPVQIGFAEAEIETEAGKEEFTAIVMAFDVAGLLETQVRLEVITQVITSLFDKAALV